MMGTCIISFDCEGKWGLMDNLNSYHDVHFTSENINKAYKGILDALQEKNFAATFAFVGAFTMNGDYVREEWLPRLLNSEPHQSWLKNFLNRENVSNDSSWFCPELISLVRSYENNQHEICSHGFTHLPWDTKNIEALLLEIDGILEWYRIHSVSSNTFIFPRNIIQNKELLAKFEILAYRNKAPYKSSIPGLKRLKQLFDEFNLNIKSSPVVTNLQTPLPIPGEIFLNWRSGIRRIIPINVTIRRFESVLDHAIENNGVVNLWSHPHNFISGDRQHELFHSCLDVLNKKVKSGDMQTLTQEEYVKKNYSESF